MNLTQLDQLRDELRRETEQLQPVGLGVEDVKRRGSRRRNRGRALVAVATVTCLAGAGVALSHRSGGKHVIDIAEQPTTPPPALQFRVVNGEVGYATHFTSSDGVTYALSTAPAGVGTPEQPGQAIYSTNDGEHWTTADQGPPWISDLTAGNGVLYAIGTAPGAGGDVSYRVGTSHDGGKGWTKTDLPFDQQTPSATVSLSRSASVHLARSASTTVALLTEQFSPDSDAMVAAHSARHENVSAQQTANGYDLIDIAACIGAKQQAMGAGGTATTTIAPDAGKRLVEANCKNFPVLGTISWSDIGLHSAADLTRQQVLVSSDGTHWDHATAPATGFVTDLVADGDGFLLLADSGRTFQGQGPGTESRLLRSTDAHTWTEVTTPTGLNVLAISGDRVIGTDSHGAIQTSNDAGSTWTATNEAAQLPAGAAPVTGTISDVGPLGFAVVANTTANTSDAVPGHDYLLFSTDGISWSTNDLATTGKPADAYPSQVIVGADHIGVDYQGPVGAPNTPAKITTVLATPTR